MKNGAIPILTPPFSHFPQQKTPQRPSIRTSPFLVFALFTPRSLCLCTAPSTPSRLPRFALSPLRFAPQSSLAFALHAPRLSHPSHFPWQKTPIGGPIAKKMPPFGQKTPLGGLIRQKMRRPLDHIGKGPLLPRRKTAGQRIVHHELPQYSQNPSPATRPPSGVFCQMSPASPQCPLDSPSKQSDWRVFRVIRLASFPNDLPGKFAQAVLHASRGHRQVRRPRCRRRIRQRISQWLHDACARRSADEPPSATPTTLPIFQKTSRPFSTWLAKANARKERP